MRSLDT